MKIEQGSPTQKVSFQKLAPISKKAYKVGGKALRESEIMLHSRSAAYTNLEIIPKIGLISKVQSLIFFVSKEGEKRGNWFCLSTDPKGYLPKNNKRYLTVDSFTRDNILEAHLNAKKLLEDKEEGLLAKNTATLFPTDSVLLLENEWFSKVIKKLSMIYEIMHK